MMFRLAVLALMTATASAFSGEFDPSPKQLRRLVDGATLLEGRGLGNNNNNNNNAYYLNGEMAKLSLKYSGCANVYSLGNGQGGGGGGNNKDGGGNIRNSAVVTFELREGCTGALVGKYATSMLTFVDSYTESMMTELEYKCESYFEQVCYGCDGSDDASTCYESCISGKYDSTGYDVSVCSQYIDYGNGGNNQADFEIQRYLECQKLQNNGNNNNNNNNNNNGNNNNNNGNNNQNYNNANGYAYNNDYTNAYTTYPQFDGKFRVGPYCAKDGFSIMLGVFYDQYCSVQAPSSVYSNLNYGEALPFSTKSIIPKSSCVSCTDTTAQNNGNNNNNNNQNNNNNNQNGNNNNWYNMYPKQFCTNSYATAAKCENTGSSYLNTYGATVTGCDFIAEYLPTLVRSSAFSLDSSVNPAAILAWTFAATSTLFGAYAYFLYRKIKRGTTTLSSQNGGTLA